MPAKNEREYRNLAELLAPQEDEKRVQGYATTFDQPYKLGGDGSFEFWEVVDRGAFNDTDMSESDGCMTAAEGTNSDMCVPMSNAKPDTEYPKKICCV